MRDILIDVEAGIMLTEMNPVKRVQNQARANLPKRFYKDVTVVETDTKFVIQLDGRPAKTPGRAALAFPTQAAAQLVADEFAAQDTVIEPISMPAYRLANTVIDGVAREADAVAEDILKFSSSDMLCYRADGPERLVARESEAWDPILDWAASKIGARFVLAEGTMHVAQPPQALQAVKHYLTPRMEPFRLGALHLMTTLMGSAVLALAVEAGELSADEAWKTANVDEDWQAELWGQDDEAIARRAAKWRDMQAAAQMLAAL